MFWLRVCERLDFFPNVCIGKQFEWLRYYLDDVLRVGGFCSYNSGKHWQTFEIDDPYKKLKIHGPASLVPSSTLSLFSSHSSIPQFLYSPNPYFPYFPLSFLLVLLLSTLMSSTIGHSEYASSVILALALARTDQQIIP